MNYRSWIFNQRRYFSSNIPRRNFGPPAERKPNRVLVTGLGIISPLGTNVEIIWGKLLRGDHGIVRLKEGYDEFPSQIVARVPRGQSENEFKLSEYVDRTQLRTMNPDNIAYAIAASGEALHSAGLLSLSNSKSNENQLKFEKSLSDSVDPMRVGVSIGTGIGDISETISSALTLHNPPSTNAGYRKISPFFVPRILGNMAAGNVSIRYGLRGPNHATSTACATGAHAIGDAFRMVKYGDADIMVAGGTEGCIAPLVLCAFGRATALSTLNSTPEAASRPFDAGRNGFVLGEGAAVLVLESEDSVRRRNAFDKVLCEIRGYGMGGDANHPTLPREDGSGTVTVMKAALAEAGLKASDINYINAHATSTRLGDAIESNGIAIVLDSENTNNDKNISSEHIQKNPVFVSSTKGAVGHLLGAAGAIEAAFAALSINKNQIPPTRNLDDPSTVTFRTSPNSSSSIVYPAITSGGNCVEYSVDGKKDVSDYNNSSYPVDVALSNSFGFGGTNTSLVFTSYSGN